MKGNTFTVKTEVGEDVGTFQIDASKLPRTIDVTLSDGTQTGEIRKGISEQDESTYKVCMAPEGEPRPQEFKTSKNTGAILEVLKKEKP